MSAAPPSLEGMKDRGGSTGGDGAPAADEPRGPDFFDLAGSDPELLNSGAIPDPQPGHTPLFRWLARVLTAIEARLRARGAAPVRGLIRFFWIFVAAVGVFLLVGPVVNKPADFDQIIASAKVADVDWVARDARIDYSVERDDAGAFVARVSESYTADFLNGPESAIERRVVTEFHGHDARFALHSATIDGEEARVDVTRGPAYTTIRVFRADGERLESRHEIAIAYELHDLVSTVVDETLDRPLDQWSWPLFASWPQATAGIEASFTLSREIADELVREPTVYIGFLLANVTQRLEPKERTAESVRYSFSNDQNLPPNTDFWFTASFEPGTFVQPPTTALFWWQSYGPLLPLAMLGVLLLFALAARRVVWADSAGEPWYLPRSEPPDDLPPELAARLLRRTRHAELIDALRVRPVRKASVGPSADPGTRSVFKDSTEGGVAARRERWLRHVARVGRRTGRFGSIPTVWAQASRWSGSGKNDPILERKLRWKPDSYVRDTFLLAPIAITLVQWGLLRQLSEQVILSVVWWPFAFVVVSTALALATIAAVAKPRPLTRAGALVLQQLKGIRAYARATRLADRGPIDDPLLPYALLFEPPRAAGNAATALAIDEARDPGLARGWRDDRFISIPAMLAFAASLAVLAGAIVTVSTQPAPYSQDHDHLTRFDDLPGTFYTQTTGFEIEAELSRDEHGDARLSVLERNTVDFEENGPRAPQFAREWPSERLGQDLGLEIVSMRIDGEKIPFRVVDNPVTDSRAAVTQLAEAVSGEHEVEVEYVLAHPVVAVTRGAETVEQLRWVAQYFFWEDEFYPDLRSPFDGTEPVRPIRVQFALAPELVDAVRQGGWIDSDYDRAREPGEFGNWFAPWEYEASHLSERTDEFVDFRVGSLSTRADGAQVAVLDFDAFDEAVGEPVSTHSVGLGSDLGVRIDFARGTFADLDPGGVEQHRAAYAMPYVVLLVLAALVTAASIAVFAVATRVRWSGRTSSASLLLVGWAAVPIAAVAQFVLFCWVIGPAPGSDPRIPAALIVGGLMFVAVIAGMIAVGRAAAGAATAATAPGNGKSAEERSGKQTEEN